MSAHGSTPVPGSPFGAPPAPDPVPPQAAPVAAPAPCQAAPSQEGAAAEVEAERERRWAEENAAIEARWAADRAWTERNRTAGLVWGILAPAAEFSCALVSAEAFAAGSPMDEEYSDGMNAKQAEAARARCEARLLEHADLAARALSAAGFLVARSNCGRGVFYLGRLADADRPRWDVVVDLAGDLGCYQVASAYLAAGVRLCQVQDFVDKSSGALGYDALVGAVAGEHVLFVPRGLDCRSTVVWFGLRDVLRLPPAATFEALCKCAPEIVPAHRIDMLRRRAWGSDDRTPSDGASIPALVALLEQEKRVMSPRPEDLTRFVVAGLLPAGKVTLMSGWTNDGKSTLALQVAAAVGSGEASVLGRGIDPAFRGGATAFLSAEDDDAETCERMGRLARAGMDAVSVRIITKGRRVSLDGALLEARALPSLAVLVVDPATAWMGDFGSANEDKPVSAFMDELRLFAEETGAAVLVIHHPPKPPRRPAVGWLMPRGSQVWVDRARLLLSFERAPGGAVVTVQKSNLRDAPKGDVLRLSFDPETGMHHPVLGAAAATVPSGGATAPAVAADAAAILPAMARLAADGQKVTRTGKGSLYGRRMHRPDSVPEVDGWPRARCVAAIECGLAAGLFRADPAAGIVPV